MDVFKVELLVIDTDGLGEEGMKVEIENVRYPNHCLSPRVMNVEGREIEWTDAHPLNQRDTQEAEYNRLFGLEMESEVEGIVTSANKLAQKAAQTGDPISPTLIFSLASVLRHEHRRVVQLQQRLRDREE